MEQTGQVYSGPVTATPRRRTALVVILVVVVLLAAIGTGYFLFIRSIRGQKAALQPASQSEWTEYTNADGFKISYPKNLALTETSGGVSLVGDGELTFYVRELSGSLRASVGSQNLDTFTAGYRTGYKVVQNDTTRYFFPLFGTKYLEVVARGGGEEIVSRLEFVAPKSASFN